MADIYFKCGCGKNLAVDESGAGRMVNCPDCGTRFMIPGAALEWVCPQCDASMLAPEEMCGTWVQCVNCQSEVRVPEADDRENKPQEGAPAETEGPKPENLSANLNQLFKDCPQCHERVPVRTWQCPYCKYLFFSRSPRGVVTGALCGVIVAGILLGLWQAKIWPFASGKTASPASPPPPVKAADRSASNGVASVPAWTPVQTVKTETVWAADDAPAGVPADTNAVSAEEWLLRFEMSRQFIAGKADKAYPRCSTNQLVSLRRIDGLVVHGTHTGAEAASITLIMNGNPTVIAFQNLDAYDRLKVDDEFRSTWIDAQASALSRRSLEQDGIKVPSLSSNSEEFLDQAISLGDPQAQYQMAQQYYKQKDYGYAILYFLAASAQNHAPAQYALGVICYQGIGIGADRKEGIKWLALAAAQGHAKAEQFIQQHKVSAETRQKLLQQEQARKERESQEQAKAFKTYQSQPQSLPPDRPASSLQGPAPSDTKDMFP